MNYTSKVPIHFENPQYNATATTSTWGKEKGWSQLVKKLKTFTLFTIPLKFARSFIHTACLMYIGT